MEHDNLLNGFNKSVLFTQQHFKLDHETIFDQCFNINWFAAETTMGWSQSYYCYDLFTLIEKVTESKLCQA